jgi:hypothetical protein
MRPAARPSPRIRQPPDVVDARISQAVATTTMSTFEQGDRHGVDARHPGLPDWVEADE